MRNITTRAVLIAVAAALVIGASAFVASAATAPSVASDSDISDGATVEIVNASSDETSYLNVTTPTGENADVEVEIEVADRNLTTYEADSDSSDYELAEEDNADSNDVHSFAITHDEFADVPVAANGSVTLDYTVTASADDGTTAETNGTFTLDNGWERSVIVLDQSALDGDVSGLSVDESNETSFIDRVPGIDASSTTYDAENEDVGVDGANTTVHVYMADSTVADNFESASDAGILTGTFRGWTANLEVPGVSNLGNSLAPDVSPESGDRTFGMTAAADGEAVPVFIDSADSDVVDTSNDTYAVYDTDADAVEYHFGEGEYENASSVDLRSASMEPETVVGMDSFSDAMTSDLTRREYMEAFGVRAWAGTALSGLSIFTIGFVAIRRKDIVAEA